MSTIPCMNRATSLMYLREEKSIDCDFKDLMNISNSVFLTLMSNLLNKHSRHLIVILVLSFIKMYFALEVLSSPLIGKIPEFFKLSKTIDKSADLIGRCLKKNAKTSYLTGST
ncbi:hypothetical protein JL09_g5822 [Pichia kudriavzevii]|uniref:Uncharacterized protein n=1 Tax=Pichia kudriavzevii TaxID=4909 RepID=A0A099NSL6_PICKU|nr:hypothetical protein JL09_g5822 [Pichia kudriavzevii]